MPEADDLVTLVYDDGEEETFSVVDVIQVDGNIYAVLLPEDEDAEASDEEYIFRVEKDENGEEIFVDIDDDENEKVLDALDERYELEEDEEKGDEDEE